MTEGPTEFERRTYDKLRRDFGPILAAALEDKRTIEVLLNPDGRLWQERLGEAMTCIGYIDAARAEAIIKTVASHLGKEVTHRSPLLEGELPPDGARFAGQVPPVVSAPSFAIRKPAVRLLQLDDYVGQGVLTPWYCAVLKDALAAHRNVLVVGGTGSGKTTFVNALIAFMVQACPDERPVILEDTREVRCAAQNCVQYHTSPSVSMTDLLRTTLRMRPDRILVGEVRGPEALDLLMAWNTGHEGGAATIHANDARAGLVRLQMLVSMHRDAPSHIEPLIAEAVDLVVHIARTPEGRRVQQVLQVQGHGADGYRTKNLEERVMRRETFYCMVAVAFVVALLLWDPSAAHASAGSGGGLPYETALDKLKQSTTGPVASSLSLMGIVVAGGVLIFGGDISGFFRSMVLLVLVIGVMVSAANLMQTLFGTGATIAEVQPDPRQDDPRQGEARVPGVQPS